MKWCGLGGFCNFGLDKSSDRVFYVVYVLDLFIVLILKVGFFKWFDFFVILIDLSGEFFSCIGGGSGSNLVFEMNVLGKDWIVCSCFCEDGINGRVDCD